MGLVSSIATSLRYDQSDFTLGPYLAFSVHPSDRFQWGLGSKNFVSGRPTLSTLSPILTCALPGCWDVGLSDMTYVYDWRTRELLNAPLGITVGKVVGAGRQPVRAFLQGEYNFKNTPDSSKFRILLGLSLLLDR